jgi:hypothetical protein
MLRALKERSGDGHLALCCAFPARHKARCPKGPKVEKRRRNSPECNKGIKNWGLRQQLRLGRERVLNKTVRQTFELVVASEQLSFPSGCEWLVTGHG